MVVVIFAMGSDPKELVRVTILPSHVRKIYNCMHFLQLREGYASTRSPIEMALVSNAPTFLKVKVI